MDTPPSGFDADGGAQPPDLPDLPPDVVRSLAEFSRRWADWLQDDHLMAELHGHVISREQTLTAEGYRFMQRLFEEWGQ